MAGAFTIPRQEIVRYGPEELRLFKPYGVEWIDNLHFLGAPEEFLGARSKEYVAVAKERFREARWAGDGDIRLLWLPAFVFPIQMKVSFEGVVLWHVKQKEDGLSFLLSPLPLPFEEFQDQA